MKTCKSKELISKSEYNFHVKVDFLLELMGIDMRGNERQETFFDFNHSKIHKKNIKL